MSGGPAGTPAPEEMLAHDLAGLLAAARGRVELALAELAGGAELRGERLDRLRVDLHAAQAELETMGAMIGEVMRAGRGDAALHAPFDPFPVLHAELGRLLRSRPGVHVALNDRREGGGRQPRGSSTLFLRAAANVLRNALDHARGRVHVTLHADAQWCTVAVEDDGPGVPEALREGLFRERVQGARGGAGIGLASAAAAAERLGATLALRPARELGGARFELVLPLAAARPLHGMRVLVVDDVEAVRRLYVRLLELRGARAEALAPDAPPEELRRRLAELRPHAALIDVGSGDAGLMVWGRVHEAAPEAAERSVFFSGDVESPGALRAAAVSGCPLYCKVAPLDELVQLLGARAGAAPAAGSAV